MESVFLRRLYVLFFIEHGTRRVQLAGCTTNPSDSWVTQQARNLGFFLAEEQIRFLIRNRDRKYSGSFDEVFRSERIRIVRTPSRVCADLALRLAGQVPLPAVVHAGEVYGHGAVEVQTIGADFS